MTKPELATARPAPGALAAARVVLVGTGQHSAGSTLPDVPAVPATLTDLRQALIDRCGVRPAAITVLTDPDSVEEFGAAIADAAEQAEELLLVYYVGHGLVADDGTLHLATAGSAVTGQRVRFTALPYATVRACVAESRAPARVVVLDCCYAGLAMPSLGTGTAEVTDLARIAGALVLTATGRHELALAPVEERHTAFTGALLRLLASGDPTLPPVLSFDDVFRHLERELPAAGLPRPRRLVSGDLAALPVAANPAPPAETGPAPATADEPPATEPAAECPYKGLAAYQTDDERWFFGRSREVAGCLSRLTECLASARPLLLLGASGAGKSSLLRAGVLPALARGDLGVAGSAWWPRRLFTPTADPIGEVARQVADLTGRTGSAASAGGSNGSGGSGSAGEAAELADRLRRDPTHLAALLRDPGRERVVLVVDQFEELFAASISVADRRAFIQALTAAASDADGSPAALLVLGVRADFYGQCVEQPELAAALEGQTLILRAMTLAETRQAITGPAAAAGRTVDPGLVEVLLTDLGANEDAEPAASAESGPEPETDAEAGAYEPGRLPLLSHALRMTWLQAGGTALSVTAYRRTGGIHRALATTADEVMAGLDETGRQCARQLLLRLIHITEDTTPTRRHLDRETLLADLPDPARGRAVLAAFSSDRARLVTADDDAVTITHEALLRGWPTLRGWIELDRAGLVIEQQLLDDARAWHLASEDAALLYRGSRLVAAAGWASAPDRERQLSPQAQRFLRISRRQDARRRRVRTVLIAVLSVLLVAASASAVVAWQQRGNAIAQQRIASARGLQFQADALLARDPVGALRLAVAAHEVNPNRESRTALTRTLATGRLTAVLDVPDLTAMAISPNGRLMATTTGDEVTVWDATEPGERRSVTKFSLPPDPNRPFSFRNAAGQPEFSPDGQLLAVASYGRVWLLDMRGLRNRGIVGSVRTSTTAAIAFARDGRTLTVASKEGSTLWTVSDPAHPVRVATLAGVGRENGDVALSPDGRWIATTGGDGTVRLDSVSEPRRTVVLAGHTDDVTTVTFSPDGRQLATAGRDDRVILWNVADPIRPVRTATLDDHASDVYAIAFAPDGRTLATASQDRTALLWDVTDPARPRRTAILAGHTETVGDVAFTEDGRTLATAGHDDAIMFWSVNEPGQHTGSVRLDGHADAVSGVTFGRRDDVVATTSWDGTARMWSMDPPRPVATLRGHKGDVFGAAFSPDRRLLLTGGVDLAPRLWQVTDPARPELLAVLPRQETVFVGAVFSPDSKRLVTLDWGCTLTLWNVADPRRPIRIGGDDAASSLCFGLAITADGRTLATVNVGHSVRLWRLTDRDRIVAARTLTGHTEEVRGVAFSPDGTLVATASKDNTARVWDLTDPLRKTPIAAIRDHDNIVADVAFSPDGHTLATAGWDRVVLLWNVTDPKRPVRTARLSGHTGHVTAVSFSPDGHTLATAGADKTARLWDVRRELAIAADPVRVACGVTRRGLSREEWSTQVPDLSYQATC